MNVVFYGVMAPIEKERNISCITIIHFGQIILYRWTIKKINRLIAFFETYDDLKTALETRFHLDGKDYRWTRPQSVQQKKKSGKNSSAREPQKVTDDRSSSLKRSSRNAKDSSKSAGSSKAHDRSLNLNAKELAGIKRLVRLLKGLI
ncbi:hypothetical protein RCL_jg9510.t1 [Rhizophagus clarus]|uniref:Uncharacterized protein n=1 Tax=Rhizophagus clarus TaxID=94130 RepID=A0A8H3QLE5_9GLOM|nr:hypothetical protein RCL_jg9510.t1 [Rhizophagus clarus]